MRTKCLNCGNQFKGDYCPHCGQKAKTKRLKIREIIADFANSIIGGDNKFANTCLGLCKRPGHMVREYLQGHRARYYNPLQMLIWLISIYALYSYLIGKDPFGTYNDLTGSDPIISDDLSGKNFLKFLWNFGESLMSNKLFNMLLAALVSVGPFWYVFRKYNIQRPDGAMLHLNHTEQFYVQIYQSCLEMLFAILILPLSLIFKSEYIIKDINDGADFVFTIIIYKQIYRMGSWKSIRLCVYAALLTILNVVVCLVLLGSLVFLIYWIVYGPEDFHEL